VSSDPTLRPSRDALPFRSSRVLHVAIDDTQPIEARERGRRAGWHQLAYFERIGERQLGLFRKEGADPLQVAGGNYITLQHANGEYTFYAHLAKGSTRVKQGQFVKRGEHLAGVGGTGETLWVHLHFQVTDGVGVMARGLPYRFVDHVPAPDVLNTQKPMEPGMFYWLVGDGFPKAQ